MYIASPGMRLVHCISTVTKQDYMKRKGCFLHYRPLAASMINLTLKCLIDIIRWSQTNPIMIDVSPTDALVRTILMRVPEDIALNGMPANNTYCHNYMHIPAS